MLKKILNIFFDKMKSERGEVFTDPFGIKSAQNKANEAAAQEAEKARQEQLRIEQKFGLSPEETERSQRTMALEKQQQTDLQSRAGVSGEQLLRQTGPTTNALLDLISSRLGKSSEQLFAEEGGEPARQLLQQMGTGSTQDAIFENELQLALQGVRQQLGRRGLTSTGTPGDIGLESMGRAGVDLAIKGARERLAQQSALANTLFNISSGKRQEAGALGERALGEQETARNNLQTFLQNLQSLDQSSRQRAASVGLGAFQTAQPIVSQFGNVPIEIAGFEAGRGAKAQEDVIGGLSDIGLALATGGASVPAQAASRVADERSKSRTEQDSLERLLAFSGGDLGKFSESFGR